MPKPAQSTTQARLGRAIRERRRELGLSLGQLAADLGVATSTLSKLENGLLPITFDRLETISVLLNVDMASLLSGRRKGGAQDDLSEAPRRDEFGSRRAITRAGDAVRVEGGVYTLSFHGSDLLDKRLRPIIAEVLCRDIRDYGPMTHHEGEEWNYVASGVLEFHTDVYAPVTLRAGDSIYFDAEMGHAHIWVGDEPCVLIAAIVPRSGQVDRGDTAPVLTRGDNGDAGDGASGKPDHRV